MRCHQIQPLLSPFLDEHLDPGERRQVQQHLRECFRCRQQYESLVKVRSLLRNLPTPQPKPDFWKLALQRAVQSPTKKQRLPLWREFLKARYVPYLAPLVIGTILLVTLLLPKFLAPSEESLNIHSLLQDHAIQRSTLLVGDQPHLEAMLLEEGEVRE